MVLNQYFVVCVTLLCLLSCVEQQETSSEKDLNFPDLAILDLGLEDFGADVMLHDIQVDAMAPEFSGQAQYVATATGYVKELHIIDDQLYWLQAGQGKIYTVPSSGGEVVELIEFPGLLPVIWSIALEDEYIYWSIPDALGRTNRETLEIETFQNVEARGMLIALDDTHIYFAEGNPGRIHKRSKNNGLTGSRIVATVEGNPIDLAVNKDGIYVVYRAVSGSKAGAAFISKETNFVTVLSSSCPNTIIADDSGACWADSCLASAFCNTGEHSQTTIIEEHMPISKSFVFDGDSVIWAQGVFDPWTASPDYVPEPGAIMQNSRSGNEASIELVPSNGELRSILVDEEALYWIDEDSHEIYRLLR